MFNSYLLNLLISKGNYMANEIFWDKIKLRSWCSCINHGVNRPSGQNLCHLGTLNHHHQHSAYWASVSVTSWHLTFWNLWLLTSVYGDLCLCRVWCPGTFPPMSSWCLPVSVNKRSALGFLMLALIFPDTFHLSTERHIALELEGQPSVSWGHYATSDREKTLIGVPAKFPP